MLCQNSGGELERHPRAELVQRDLEGLETPNKKVLWFSADSLCRILDPEATQSASGSEFFELPSSSSRSVDASARGSKGGLPRSRRVEAPALVVSYAEELIEDASFLPLRNQSKDGVKKKDSIRTLCLQRLRFTN